MNRTSSRQQEKQPLNPNNLILTVSNLSALNPIVYGFVYGPSINIGFIGVSVVLFVSMTASMAYHYSELTYRNHPWMNGRRVLNNSAILVRLKDTKTDHEAEEAQLLLVDRILSAAGLICVVAVCGWGPVVAVAIGPSTCWILPLALTCAMAGEIKKVKEYRLFGISGYAWLHSVWHVLVYQLPFLVMFNT
ncbi:hypothetical protein BDR26DRAFT_859873 [Obelidium mucronatum]|nr:hypothetical protein BDR26DRAFT_859873 [Obelidium mucronatum]